MYKIFFVFCLLFVGAFSVKAYDVIPFGFTASTINASTTYYFGQISVVPGTSGIRRSLYAPATSTITGVSVVFSVYSVSSSSTEQSVLKMLINGSVVATLTSSVMLNTTFNRYHISGLNIPVNTDDKIDFALTSTSWTGSAPSSVYGNGLIELFSSSGASSSYSTTTVDIDTDNQTLFYGFLIFFISMIFVIWFFKNRNTN